MKKKILITGSNGLLGQKLVNLLLPNADVELLATSRGENKLAAVYPQLTFVSLDVTNPDEVQQVVATHQPTHIIHTAAMTNVDECEVNRDACWKLNVDAVAYLVKAAEENNVHFTHLSTDFIFDGSAGPYDEEAAANPISYYGESKLAAEELVKQSSASWAIVRTVLVYGIVHDYGRSNIVLWVKNSLESKKPIKVVDDQFRTPTLAEDLALGCWLIADQDAEGVFNISSKELVTPYDMALQVADYFKLDTSYITRADASSFTQTAKRPARTGFIITKAEEQLGFRPHTFTEGIAVVASQLPLS
ncbi:SDR family oxidoreductase [Adhaeribacter swui]|uniref:dTDP-4-dehydrorhamnose reductase n=1 Tax=Adhaeribacter swui TaxID=2086471 RepID=A0A7G7G578_9BACT|nr:SDR family oxidoreductase [Adhaeribacter swui]QNF32312.1 SDR family oxidoreductase [Adhaeribacter swui]